MTQNQFSRKFTKVAFIKFLKSLNTKKTKIKINSSECFLGVFAKGVFDTKNIEVWWRYIQVDGFSFEYPQWCQKYLNYLSTIKYNDPAEVRKLSVKFLNK